jgi:hypothetical protein
MCSTVCHNNFDVSHTLLLPLVGIVWSENCAGAAQRWGREPLARVMYFARDADDRSSRGRPSSSWCAKKDAASPPPPSAATWIYDQHCNAKRYLTLGVDSRTTATLDFSAIFSFFQVVFLGVCIRLESGNLFHG